MKTIKPTGASAPVPAKEIRTGPLKRVTPPGLGSPATGASGTGTSGIGKGPLQTSPVDHTASNIAALQSLVQQLEQRVAALEALISVQNGDTVIASNKSVLISAASSVEVSGATIRSSAGTIEQGTALLKCTGMVQCATLTAGNVVASSYSGGSGNVW